MVIMDKKSRILHILLMCAAIVGASFIGLNVFHAGQGAGGATWFDYFGAIIVGLCALWGMLVFLVLLEVGWD